MKYKNIVFDIGNVLIEYRWRDMLRDHGMAEERIEHFAKNVFMDPIWNEFDLGNLPFEEIVAAYIKKYPDWKEDIDWFLHHTERMHVIRHNVGSLLGKLKAAGYQLYLLSNYNDILLENHTDGAEFKQHVDGGVISYQVHVIKPDPAIYHQLFEKYELKPEECLFFDDRQVNVDGAKACGMDAVLVTSEKQLIDEIQWLLESAAQKREADVPVYDFFATVARMKYINRWALMRNSREENLSEHSTEVAMLAHALCTIGNVRYGRHLNAEKAALAGLYHDTSEIITGDLPTPIKYDNDEIREAYKKIEARAEAKLLSKLPEDLVPAFAAVYGMDKLSDEDPDEAYMRQLVKAADKLSALIKCIEEVKSGNTEFSKAGETIQEAVNVLAAQYPEVKDFTQSFLPAYKKTLDEL